MALLPLEPAELRRLIDDPASPRPWAGNVSPDVLVVDLDALARHGLDPATRTTATAPRGEVTAVIVGTTSVGDIAAHPAARFCDVAFAPGDELIERVVDRVDRNPIASAALAVLLRGSELRDVDEGLAAESAFYSTLQAGPEFAAWRAATPVRVRAEEGDPVRIERTGDELTITLDRPVVRNALNAAMRDALIEALSVAVLDDSVDTVHLRGAGPSFCSGGDLDEFGTAPDPATAHVIRLERSVGRVIDSIRPRVIAHLHGACAGSGIELPAFAGHVVAHASTVITLPELALGLIPGAGGTVSLPRRIGRHATARLALTGESLTAETALRWGLVDELTI